jgi:PAS domain-containing protein
MDDPKPSDGDSDLEEQVRQRTAELEEADRALREAKTRIEAVYDHHCQLTGLIDRDGGLIMGNRTALQFAGIGLEDVAGKPFWETPWLTCPRYSGSDWIPISQRPSFAAQLLGDPGLNEALFAALAHPKSSQPILAATTGALGATGNQGTVTKLISVLEPGVKDGAYSDLTRHYAAAALGRIAMRGEEPLARIARDFPYLKPLPLLVEVLEMR